MTPMSALLAEWLAVVLQVVAIVLTLWKLRKGE